MNRRTDERKWAYLDGELSPAEAADLDQALSSEERARFASELRFERTVAAKLSDAACPDNSWWRAKASLQRRRAGAGRFAAWMGWRAAAVFACFAVVAAAAVFFRPQAPTKTEHLPLQRDTLGTLKTRAQVTDGLPSARAVVQAAAFNVSLDPLNSLEAAESPYRLLGARGDDFHGELVVRLFFDCSGAPAEMVLVPRAGQAAAEVGRAVAAGDLESCRQIGNALVAVIGSSVPSGLVQIIDETSFPAPDDGDAAGAIEIPSGESATDAAGTDIEAPDVPDDSSVFPNEDPGSTTNDAGISAV